MSDRVDIIREGDWWIIRLDYISSRVRVDPSQEQQYQYTDVLLSAMAAELVELRGKMDQVRGQLTGRYFCSTNK